MNHVLGTQVWNPVCLPPGPQRQERVLGLWVLAVFLPQGWGWGNMEWNP